MSFFPKCYVTSALRYRHVGYVCPVVPLEDNCISFPSIQAWFQSLQSLDLQAQDPCRGQTPRYIQSWEIPACTIDWDSDMNLWLCGLFLLTGRTTPYCLAIRYHPVHTKNSGVQRLASMTIHPVIPWGTDSWPPAWSSHEHMCHAGRLTCPDCNRHPHPQLETWPIKLVNTALVIRGHT